MKHLKQKYFQFSCRLAYMPFGGSFLPTALLLLLLPSLWWLSERFGTGAFNGMQVIRVDGFTYEEKTMWKLHVDFICHYDWMQPSGFYIQQYLLLMSWAVRWAVADRQTHTAIYMHFLCYLLSPCMLLS